MGLWSRPRAGVPRLARRAATLKVARRRLRHGSVNAARSLRPRRRSIDPARAGKGRRRGPSPGRARSGRDARNFHSEGDRAAFSSSPRRVSISFPNGRGLAEMAVGGGERSLCSLRLGLRRRTFPSDARSACVAWSLVPGIPAPRTRARACSAFQAAGSSNRSAHDHDSSYRLRRLLAVADARLSPTTRSSPP